MNNIITIIENSKGTKFFAGKVGKEEILTFERKNGISFPQDYRDFVENFGCGSIGSLEIFGLGCPETGIPNLQFALDVLKRNEIDMPEDTIPISFNGLNYIFLNVNSQSSEFGNIVDEDNITLSNTFYDYIKDVE